MNRKARQGFELGDDIHLPPRLHLLRRRADLLGPGPQFEGHGDAEPGDPSPLFRGERAGDRIEGAGDEIDDGRHLRKGVGQPLARPDRADEIHQHELDRAPADLQAEREGAVGIEPHRDRRLADPAAARLFAQDQFLCLEHSHDDRGGLRREACAPRDVGLGQFPVAANERQHRAFVMGAKAGLVGAAHARLADAGRKLAARARVIGCAGGISRGALIHARFLPVYAAAPSGGIPVVTPSGRSPVSPVRLRGDHRWRPFPSPPASHLRGRREPAVGSPIMGDRKTRRRGAR